MLWRAGNIKSGTKGEVAGVLILASLVSRDRPLAACYILIERLAHLMQLAKASDPGQVRSRVYLRTVRQGEFREVIPKDILRIFSTPLLFLGCTQSASTSTGEGRKLV